MSEKSKTKTYDWGTGRRKNAIARVRIKPGKGEVIVNGGSADAYFKRKILGMVIRQPLIITDTLNKVDVFANINGGGLTGQAGALRHGISRALLTYDASLRPILKKAGFLTRDPRMVERKKPGLHGARRGTQFSKR
ncbi:MAG: 30S ribosomal protein S9 [Candidatus Wallbacteria bacterium HGW-Wallbacteria-1]|jgi:small subunit ribosomal protein S9|uniref:Small ribosomal subunit protein uS9 n=1 Tax=Candidatus Wallbacteria bacterium HGW-Wallbacteria-1 TaxID=2013854 RepID=A0A2N1PT03_9BACT|nr:MAG: 30S ribosomal protein S9 [Candidatus Wallbacteria bacterium HGW-Wallbacteria-1]